MQINPETIAKQVQLALREDVGEGDVTANLIDAQQISTAKVITRETGIICGTQWFDETFYQVDTQTKVTWSVQDGDAITAKQILCTINGPTRAILTAERTALNFLQTLSATATITQQYTEALRGTQVKVLDTRKTIPGLRLAQKYAVTCGGGMNHRMGLYDMILIKENHIASCGSISEALSEAFKSMPKDKVEIEVENLEQLEKALTAGATRILLDNFELDELHKAVQLNQQKAKLEVSGNVTLENIRDYALTGIDYISSGAITKNIRALDFSLQID